MAPLNRIIIDTDPGVDDTLAMLLALAAKPEELEVLMLSVTYGNVEVQSCLKNVVALFHVLEKEMEWRRARGQEEGFEALKAYKPIVAVGADHALEQEILEADYFHGIDGLGGVHESHPHLSPGDAWRTLFDRSTVAKIESNNPKFFSYFTPSLEPAHKEILRLLRENEPNTITLVGVGPMTNFAWAAHEDPETFLRAKEVVVMGGAIDIEGNVTPVAEFNTYADAVATARVFALTSPTPSSTLPPPPPATSKMPGLPAYPTKLSKQLSLTLMPLDITTPHLLHRSYFNNKIEPLIAAGSPLAEWVNVFMSMTFDKIDTQYHGQSDPGLSLHDPLCIWYMLTRLSPSWMGSPKGLEDIRIETQGQWTKGMHIVDRRNRKKAGTSNPTMQINSPGSVIISDPMEEIAKDGAEEEDEVLGDDFGWLSLKKGNRINRIVGTPGEDAFGPYLMERVFG